MIKNAPSWHSFDVLYKNHPSSQNSARHETQKTCFTNHAKHREKSSTHSSRFMSVLWSFPNKRVAGFKINQPEYLPLLSHKRD